MMTPEEARRALQDRRCDKVSASTGLSYNTVRAVRNGQNTNPKWETLRALSEYLTGSGKE